MRQTPGYCAAYVGNIAFEASEDDLRAVFEGLAVTRVRMHTDADTGRFKGYAHVHFGDEASLDACAPALWLGRAGLLGPGVTARTDWPSRTRACCVRLRLMVLAAHALMREPQVAPGTCSVLLIGIGCADVCHESAKGCLLLASGTGDHQAGHAHRLLSRTAVVQGGGAKRDRLLWPAAKGRLCPAEEGLKQTAFGSSRCMCAWKRPLAAEACNCKRAKKDYASCEGPGGLLAYCLV